MNAKIKKLILVAKFIVAVINWGIASMELFPKFTDVFNEPGKENKAGGK